MYILHIMDAENFFSSDAINKVQYSYYLSYWITYPFYFYFLSTLSFYKRLPALEESRICWTNSSLLIPKSFATSETIIFNRKVR